MHLPSSRLEAAVPDVIRHTALRSSDFPPPPNTLWVKAAAIIQPPAPLQCSSGGVSKAAQAFPSGAEAHRNSSLYGIHSTPLRTGSEAVPFRVVMTMEFGGGVSVRYPLIRKERGCKGRAVWDFEGAAGGVGLSGLGCGGAGFFACPTHALMKRRA